MISHFLTPFPQGWPSSETFPYRGLPDFSVISDATVAVTQYNVAAFGDLCAVVECETRGFAASATALGHAGLHSSQLPYSDREHIGAHADLAQRYSSAPPDRALPQPSLNLLRDKLFINRAAHRTFRRLLAVNTGIAKQTASASTTFRFIMIILQTPSILARVT